MKLPRCLVLALVLALPVDARTQTSDTSPEPVIRGASFPGDDRQTKLADRYRAMLAANPSEGIALDRLWKLWEDQHATTALIDSFGSEAKRTGIVSDWLIYGHLLKKAGRLDEAAGAYDQAAAADPTGYLPNLARGELALSRQQPEKAAPLLAEAVSRLPLKDRRRSELLTKLGGAWLAAGQPDKAIECWEAVVADNPTNFSIRKEIAEKYVRNHLPQQALFHLEYLAAHDAAPQQAAALREIGNIRESGGDFDAARDSFERALQLTSRDNWLHGELLTDIIRLYERAHRGAELSERWQRAAEQSPHALDGWMHLRTLAEMDGDLSRQLDTLEKIVAITPRDRESRLKLATLLANLGEREKAAAAYDALLGEQPGRMDLLVARADLDIQAGRPDEAVKRLQNRLSATSGDETVSAQVLEYFLANHFDGPAEQLLRAAADQHPDTVEPVVALAKFYLSRRRADEARTILDHVPEQSSSDQMRTERWQRVAAVYVEADLCDDALRAWRHVENTLPTSPAPKLAMAELLLTKGDMGAAAAEFEQAVNLMPDGVERETVERRLFDALMSAREDTSAAPKEGAIADLHRHLTLRLTPPNPESVRSPSASRGRLTAYVKDLEAAAKHDPNPSNLLHLARWQDWIHATSEAADTLARVIEIDPANIPARQRLADLAVASKQYEKAQKYLRDLVQMDGAQKSVYLHQLAVTQQDQGDLDAAITTLGELAQAQSDSADATTDLALALQRADRWLDALDLWKRAYALPTLTPSQKSKTLRPFVAAYEHLGDFKAAAGTLLAAIDTQSDANVRRELERLLSEFCLKRGLSKWLEETFEHRRLTQPDDYVTLTALAELRKTQGRLIDTYDLLARAYYSAPDPAAVLKSMTEAAEAAGENERALSAWRRLLGLPGQNNSSNLQRLAVLEENNLDDESATRTWETIVTRFPRDVATLVQASEFFERNNQIERARNLLGAAVALDARDSARLLHLGELESASGDPIGARNHFETLLAQTEPASPNAMFKLPGDLETKAGPGVVASDVSSMTESSEESVILSVHDFRLRAIRELAHSLPEDTNSHLNWLQRWRDAVAQGAREEPFMAFYEAGESDAALELLELWMTEKPADDRLRSAYLQAGLRLQDYRRLADWTWPADDADREVSRGPLLIDALQQFLARDGKPSETICNELFPTHLHAQDLLWRAANSFAERHWYPQAIELGERLCALTNHENATYGFETARWLLVLGEIDHARALLREIVEHNEISYDGSGGNAPLESLRVFYSLLPEQEQTPFIEFYLRACRERGQPVSVALGSALLYGLHGDEKQADAALDAILDQSLLGFETSDSADVRRWLYVLSFGNQLQAWHLERRAVHLWRRALQKLTAFERANDSLQSTLADIHARLLVLEVRMSDNPEWARDTVASYLRQRPSVGTVSSTASQLLTLGQLPTARQLYAYLIQYEPNDGDHRRNYLSICESLNDADAAECMLQSLLDNPDTLPPAMSRAEVVRLLATWRQKDGDAAGVVRLLEAENHHNSDSSTLLTALAYAYERAGMSDEAARVWQSGATSDPGNARNYRSALARLEENRGHQKQAIDILQEELTADPNIVSGEGPLRLINLYLKTGQVTQAWQLAMRAVESQDFQTLLIFANSFAKAKQWVQARDLFATGAKRCREAGLQFQFQQEWLQLKDRPPDESPAQYLRGLRRLRQIARSSPELRKSYTTVFFQLARGRVPDDWLEKELRLEWKEGQGNLSAGLSLSKFYQETGQAAKLSHVVEVAKAMPKASEEFLAAMAKQLSGGEHSALAQTIYESLTRRYPQNEGYTIELALNLARNGRGREAAQLLETLERTSVVRGDLVIQIAEAYQQSNLPDRATDLLRRAVCSDPDVIRYPQAHEWLAKDAAKRGSWLEVRRLLTTVSRQPAFATDLHPIVDCLFGCGEVDAIPTPGVPGREFALTFSQRAELMALICQRLEHDKRLNEASAFLTSNARFVAGSLLLAQEALAHGTVEQISACVASLEQANGQSDMVLPRTKRVLAAFYVRWAAFETNLAGTGANRLAHLVRANQLAPQDFAIARQLALLLWEEGSSVEAVRSLQPFLKADAVPMERVQARQLLATH